MQSASVGGMPVPYTWPRCRGQRRRHTFFVAGGSADPLCTCLCRLQSRSHSDHNDSCYDHLEGLFCTGGGFSFFVGYLFALGCASTQRLSFEHVGGDMFLLALDFLLAMGSLSGIIFMQWLLRKTVVTMLSLQRFWSTSSWVALVQRLRALACCTVVATVALCICRGSARSSHLALP